MTHFDDLSLHSYVGLRGDVRAVGWLEDGHPFPTGQTPRPFRKALLRLLSYRMADFCHLGVHWCSLCEAQGRSGPDATSSQWVIHVPSATVVYEAPSWIGHYVFTHQYQPPRAFQDAVIACPPPDSQEYLNRIRACVDLGTGFSGLVGRADPLKLILRSRTRGRRGAMPQFDPILYRSIDALGLGAPLLRSLEAQGIRYIGDVVQMTVEELRGCGLAPDDVSRVRAALMAELLIPGERLQGWPPADLERYAAR